MGLEGMLSAEILHLMKEKRVKDTESAIVA